MTRNHKISYSRSLSSTFALVMAIVAVGLIQSPAGAAASEKPDVTESVVVRGNLSPASPEAASRLLDRIERAALEVCGGSSFSLSEVRDAVRRTQCWKDSVDQAVARVDSPALSAVHMQSLGAERQSRRASDNVQASRD